MKKKKYKLKANVKIFFLVIVVLCGLGYFGYLKYQDYLYTKTNEYALIKLGYTKEDAQILEEKLNDDQVKDVINRGYDEFIINFVKQKYFLFKNLDEYLSKITTRDEDFFNADDPKNVNYENIVSLINVHANKKVYESDYKTDFSKKTSLIANKYYELGSDYEPEDLVSIDWKYRLGGQNDKKEIISEVYDAYLDMWEDAHKEGIYLLVDSSYRSYQKQVEVYKYYENLKGTKYADSIAARPGFSEHQTGLALDIYSKECASASKFKDTKTYKWLIENSYKYGFILRYPEGKQELTGYNYESWHYRYLGVELATRVYNEGITYDEYYAYYLEK